MKKIFTSLLVFVLVLPLFAQNEYQPSKGNLENREWFQDSKFGLFVHWGVYSVLANGEWVMNNTKIPIKQYEKLPSFFNPIDFDPDEWVAMVKRAGIFIFRLRSFHWSWKRMAYFYRHKW